MKVLVWVLCPMLWLCSIYSASAVSVDVSGFANVTAGYNSSDEIGFSPNFRNKHETNWSLLRDSSLGGQLNIGLSPQLDAVVQGVLQDRHVTKLKNYLELGFLRYRPSRNWSIRAGRMNSDLFLLSEYPYVSHAYLWARPPQEFYSYASSVGNFDGVDIEFSERVYEGFLQVKIATGKASTLFENDGVESELNYGNLWTLSASYQTGQLTLRASHTRADFDDYQGAALEELGAGLDAISSFIWPNASALADSLNFMGKTAEFSALGLSYDGNEWIIQSEFGLTESDWLIAPATLAGYVSVGRKLGDVTIFSCLAGAKVTDEELDLGDVFIPDGLPSEVGIAIGQLQSAVVSVANASINHQNSISFGAKWYATNSLTLKAQVDHFTIYPFGGVSWSYSDLTEAANKQHINIFSLSTSVVF